MLTRKQQDEALNGAVTAGMESRLVEAHQRYTSLVLGGLAPRDAIEQVMRSFTGASADTLRAAFTAFLASSLGSRSTIPLLVGPVALSARLFANPDETAADVKEILNRHFQEGGVDSRKLALELFEGYGFREREVLQMNPALPKLPEFLEDAIRSGDNEAGRMKRRAAREQVERIDSEPLKAAYTAALAALDAGASQKVIEKRIQSAWYERMRYYASCIVQYELKKVLHERKAVELMDWKDVEFARIELSSVHQKPSICDVYARVDRFGLGPGVFPKELAPRPPHHLACKCTLSPRFLFGKKPTYRQGAELAFIRNLPAEEAVRLIGSESKLAAVLEGRSVTEVFNSTLHPLHRVTTVRTAAENYAARLASAAARGDQVLATVDLQHRP